MGKLIIKDVKTLPDRTVVYCTAEGLAPLSQAASLCIKDENDNGVKSKDDWDIRKNENNPNEFIEEFEPLDKNKKYKITAKSFEDYDIREDLKFKIPLQ